MGLFVYPFITSALCEELLFRGFVAKRSIGWLGFAWGNVVQTVIFVAPHLARALLRRVVPRGPLRDGDPQRDALRLARRVEHAPLRQRLDFHSVADARRTELREYARGVGLPFVANHVIA
ncbi:MAG: lysostaphin resistance A-like protein [Polyangiales bacterium]